MTLCKSSLKEPPPFLIPPTPIDIIIKHFTNSQNRFTESNTEPRTHKLWKIKIY